MKAVRYHGPRKPLRLEEVPRPSPGPGEILVKIKAAGICHTDLHFISGLLDLGVKPLTLGHEVAGIVEALGPNVDGIREGDRVILYYYVGCARCAHCRSGNENLCSQPTAEYGFISDGGLAEYIKVPARNAVPLPANIRDEEAAPIGCGVTTAVHACRLAGLQAGYITLVYGVGGVGYGLVQLCRLAGATVIAVGRKDAKLSHATKLGAHAVINSEKEDLVERVRAITGGQGVDIVFELVATRRTMERSAQLLAKRGRLVFIGYSEDLFTIHPLHLIINEARVIGSVGNTLNELHEAVRLVSEGKIKTVVDRTLGLENFQEGIDALKAGSPVGRIVLKP